MNNDCGHNHFMPGIPAEALPPAMRPAPKRRLPVFFLSLFAALVAAVVVAGVLGAFQPPAPAAPASAAATAPATAAPAPTYQAPRTPDRPVKDVLFLSIVRDNTSVTRSDVELLSWRQMICTNLDNNPSRYGALGTALGLAAVQGISQQDAAFIMGSAVASHCPQHEGIVRSR